MDVLEVLEPGPLTTVQDLGRYGYQRYGVPSSGAMDTFALRVANLLVGNPEGAAGLEMTLAGLQVRILADTVFAVTGADMRPRLDDRLVPMWRAVAAPKGATLSLGAARAGARAYLAVAGGIDVPVVLGSRSTYLRSRLGGLDGRPLQAGDVLRVQGIVPPSTIEGRRIAPRLIPRRGGSQTVRVVLGPQDDRFTREGIRTFLSSVYAVAAQSDRMGYRFEGPRIQHKVSADLVSDGSPHGAVQVPGDGTPIVLLADRGTAGGYTKIATVITVDLARLAQACPGDRILFQAVSVEEARAALVREDAVLQQIRTSAPRVFARRLVTTMADGSRCEATIPFQDEETIERGRDTIALNVGGETYRVAVTRPESTGGREVESRPMEATADAASGPEQPLPTRGRAAAAAVAVAAALAAEPRPRDFPIDA